MTVDFVTATSEQKFTEAGKFLDAAIAACPPQNKVVLSQLLVNRGYCQQKVQLYRKALKDYDAALEVVPRLPLAFFRKGQVLAAQKKLEDARAAWNEALQSCSEATDVQLVLDISAALRDPSGVKVGREPPTSCQTPQQRAQYADGRLQTSLQALALLLLAAILNGQFQMRQQQAGLLAALAPSVASEPAGPVIRTPAGGGAVTNGSPGAGALSTMPNGQPSAASTTAARVKGSMVPALASSLPPPPLAAAPSGPPPSTSISVSMSAPQSKQPESGHTAAPSNGKGHAGDSSGASSSSRTGTSAAATGAAGGLGTSRSSVDVGAAAASRSGSLQQQQQARCDVEEVDCVAQQRAARADKRGATCSAAGNTSSAASSSAAAAAADVQTMLDNSIAIQLAVTQINNGNIMEAEALLEKVLASSPRELGARVARGTARALRRDLQGAVEDFTVAIEVEPRYSDSWKRRGQARSALGDHEGALADLQKAIDLAPLFGATESPSSRAECWVEKAMIYQKLRDYRRACRELQQAVRLDRSNAQAWNILGLCSTSQGDIREGVRAYERALDINPQLKEAWINMGQALKEEGRTAEAERALLKALSLDAPEAPSVHVTRILAQMKQQKGEHAAAVRLLVKVLPVAEKRDEQVVELLYLRAICHHALGAVREAVRDYEECLNYIPKSSAVNTTEEARQFQFLSFYQKDMSLYLYRSLDRRAQDFCPDSELPAVFKELWCKKGPPTAELISHYPPQPPLPLSQPPLPPGPDPERLRPLTALADQLGVLLQNNHQGFLFNVRQQRAAGFAAMELGQALRELVGARRANRQHWVRSEGSSGQAGSAGRHLFGWRDAMDIVVKWRQLSEPNDQVVWVDLLTRREFEQGFGSHTPMFSGQTKCVRYYMNFARALDLQREVLLREGHAFDANNRPIPVGGETQRAAIAAARTAEDMYLVIQQDSWVVVPIHSVSRPEHQMEGTRLTLVRVPNQPDAYEFSIRTPVTPPRWADFDAELEAAFEAILQAFLEDDLPKLAQRILTYCYYWYNFMPLARGTAAVGYTTMLSLFWAAGMPVTTAIPKDYQVDWEAILAQHPDQFIKSVGAWLYPPQARGLPADAEGANNEKPAFPPIDSLPKVSDLLGTIRHRLIALNGEGSKRIV